MALEFIPQDINFDNENPDRVSNEGATPGARPQTPGVIPNKPEITTPKDTTQPITPDDGIAQFEVPDWLKQLSATGIDERSRFLRQGTSIGEQSAVQQREIGEMGFLGGASESGFVKEAQRQTQLAGKKSLVDLDLAVRSEDETAKRDALGQIQAIEFQNKRIRDQEKNTARAEKLAQEQRAWQERMSRASSMGTDIKTSLTDIVNLAKGG